MTPVPACNENGSLNALAKPIALHLHLFRRRFFSMPTKPFLPFAGDSAAKLTTPRRAAPAAPIVRTASRRGVSPANGVMTS